MNRIPWNVEVPDDTLESRLELLAEMKTEYRRNKKAFEAENKNLLESIKSLENIIVGEVIKAGHSVAVGNIKAELVPQVKIRLKKVNDGE
jgi:hypothetical protein